MKKGILGFAVAAIMGAAAAGLQADEHTYNIPDIGNGTIAFDVGATFSHIDSVSVLVSGVGQPGSTTIVAGGGGYTVWHNPRVSVSIRDGATYIGDGGKDVFSTFMEDLLLTPISNWEALRDGKAELVLNHTPFGAGGGMQPGGDFMFDTPATVSYGSAQIKITGTYGEAPEPGSLSVLGIAALGFLRRRR